MDQIKSFSRGRACWKIGFWHWASTPYSKFFFLSFTIHTTRVCVPLINHQVIHKVLAYSVPITLQLYSCYITHVKIEIQQQCCISFSDFTDGRSEDFFQGLWIQQRRIPRQPHQRLLAPSLSQLHAHQGPGSHGKCQQSDLRSQLPHQTLSRHRVQTQEDLSAEEGGSQPGRLAALWLLPRAHQQSQ